MLVIKNEMVDPYDVDGTLVIHTPIDLIPPGEELDVEDAVTGSKIRVRINRPMVRLLKESAARGAYVIVWSRGGYQWASDVIKALGLTAEVNLVLSKPLVYFDDLAVESWLPHRVFIDSEANYKQISPYKVEEN